MSDTYAYEPFTDTELAHAQWCWGWDERSLRIQVEIARAQATAYVWGRQDAGESARDTGYSTDFGNHYAVMTREYRGGTGASSLPNIEMAFLAWRATRERVAA